MASGGRFREIGIRQGAAIVQRAGAIGAAANVLVSPQLKRNLARVRAAIDGIEGPTAPAVAPWELSLVRLMGNDMRIPNPALRAMSSVDRFGCVRVGPELMGFDGVDAPWEQVLEVRSCYLVDPVRNLAVDREIGLLDALLPWVPRRDALMAAIAQWLTDLSLMAMSGAIEHAEAQRLVSAALVVRGKRGQPEEVVPGIVASAVLAGVPAVGDSVLATAEQRGIAVVPPMGGGPEVQEKVQGCGCVCRRFWTVRRR